MSLIKLILLPAARLDVLRAHARAKGWRVAVDRPRGHTTFTVVKWIDPAVMWSENHGLGVRMLGCEDDAALVGELGAILPHRRRESLLAAQDLGELRALAAIDQGIEPDGPLCARIAARLSDENANVRRAVVNAIGSAMWHALAPALLARAQVEPVESIARLQRWLAGALTQS